jgi:LmbE family N-acetylglucosaminyl deacetylase
MKIEKLKLPETTNKVALVSVAHADDLLLFCGGGVAALTEFGWKVTVVRATNDRWDSFGLSESETIEANTKEFNLAMAHLGISRVIELNLDTDQLGDYSEVSLRSKYIDIIRDVQPFLVITFDPDSYLYEDNEDHRKVAVSMAEAMWTSGFDKHPGSASGGVKPFLPVARWYFGREVAKPTHQLDVTSYIDKLTAATSLHRTMLINMARQWWLKGRTAGVSLDEFFQSVNSDVRFFAEMIVRRSREKNSKSKKYSEIYRVIDDANVVSTLSKMGEK